jgi:hypothetical protein
MVSRSDWPRQTSQRVHNARMACPFVARFVSIFRLVRCPTSMVDPAQSRRLNAYNVRWSRGGRSPCHRAF